MTRNHSPKLLFKLGNPLFLIRWRIYKLLKVLILRDLFCLQFIKIEWVRLLIIYKLRFKYNIYLSWLLLRNNRSKILKKYQNGNNNNSSWETKWVHLKILISLRARMNKFNGSLLILINKYMIQNLKFFFVKAQMIFIKRKYNIGNKNFQEMTMF